MFKRASVVSSAKCLMVILVALTALINLGCSGQQISSEEGVGQAIDELNSELGFTEPEPSQGSDDLNIEGNIAQPGAALPTADQRIIRLYELKKTNVADGWTEYIAMVAFENNAPVDLTFDPYTSSSVLTNEGFSYEANLKELKEYEDGTIGDEWGRAHFLVPLAPGLRFNNQIDRGGYQMHVRFALTFKIPSTMQPETFTLGSTSYPFEVSSNLSYPFIENPPIQPVFLPTDFKIPGRLEVTLSEPTIEGDKIHIPIKAISLNRGGDEVLQVSFYVINEDGHLIEYYNMECSDSIDLGIDENNPLMVGPSQTVFTEICLKVPNNGEKKNIAFVMSGDISGLFSIARD